MRPPEGPIGHPRRAGLLDRLFRRRSGQRADVVPLPIPPDRILVGGYLDRAAADRLRRLLPPRLRPLVIDVTEITGFDSAGLGGLLALQGEHGEDRLQIVGMEAATARLVGMARTGPEIDLRPWPRLNILNHVAVVQPGSAVLQEGDLTAAMHDAAAKAQVSTVVLDLIEAPELTKRAQWELAYVAAELSEQGKHVLVVNATRDVADTLSTARLPADVYVATAETEV
jgi:hypothetical protein